MCVTQRLVILSFRKPPACTSPWSSHIYRISIICGSNIKYGSQDKRCPYGFTEQNMIALISCIVAQTKDRGQQDRSALATNHTLHARHSPSFVQTMSRHGPCWGPNLQQLCDLLLLQLNYLGSNRQLGTLTWP